MNLDCIARSAGRLAPGAFPVEAPRPARVAVTAAAADTRLILPSELVIRFTITLAAAQDLADRVSDEIAAILCREPWRQTYKERRAAPGGTDLELSRWPIEGETPTGADPEDPPAVTLAGGSAVGLTTYYVTGESRRTLLKPTWWLRGDEAAPVRQFYDVEYTAGYLSPGLLGTIDTGADPNRHVQTWEADTVYGEPGTSHAYGDATGSWVLPTTPNGLAYQMTASAGYMTSASAEPTWPTAIGATVIDNSQLTWTARPAYIVLPELARQAVLALAGKIRATNQGGECPADCADAEKMIRQAFGGICP